jgi:hypothetical protein
LAALVLASALASCAGREPEPERIEFETGARAEVTAEGLHRVSNPHFRNAWVKPAADFTSYEAIQLVQVELRYKRKPTAARSERSIRRNFALSEAQKQELERLFLEVFSAELQASEHYRLTQEPGPGVLRVEAGIIDLVVKVPTQTYGNERTFTTSTGEMTLLLELFDSRSGEILARVADRREALAAGHGGFDDLYYSNPATDTNAVLRVFRRWAQILRKRLDALHEFEPINEETS